MVQRRREWPTRLVQVLQDLLLAYVLSLAADRLTLQVLPVRMVERVPFRRALRARLFMFSGFRPELLGVNAAHRLVRRVGPSRLDFRQR